MTSIREFLERVPSEYTNKAVEYINFLSSFCVSENTPTTTSKKRRFKDMCTQSSEDVQAKKVYKNKILSAEDIVQLIRAEVAESNSRVDALTVSVEELRETMKFEIEQMFSNLILKLVKEYKISKRM